MKAVDCVIWSINPAVQIELNIMEWLIRQELNWVKLGRAGVIPLSLSYLQEPGCTARRSTSCSTSTTPPRPPSGPWVSSSSRSWPRGRPTKTPTMPSTSRRPSRATSVKVGTVHSTTHPSVYPPSHQYIHLVIHSSIHPRTFPFSHPPFIHLSAIHPPIHLSTHYRAIHPSINSVLHPSIHWSIHCGVTFQTPKTSSALCWTTTTTSGQHCRRSGSTLGWDEHLCHSWLVNM